MVKLLAYICHKNKREILSAICTFHPRVMMVSYSRESGVFTSMELYTVTMSLTTKLTASRNNATTVCYKQYSTHTF